MNLGILDDAAAAISALIDALEEKGIGPELTQKIVIAATPTIVQGAIYPYDGTGYAIA